MKDSCVVAFSDNIVCSSGTMPSALNRPYDDITAIFEVASRIPIAQLELVLHPQWRVTGPKLLPWYRHIARIFGEMERTKTRIQSVHAYRDLGVFLSAPEAGSRALGKRLLEQTILAAKYLRADQVVLHGWNTWSPDLCLEEAVTIIGAMAKAHPDIHLSLENIPVSARDWSQFRLLAWMLNRPDSRVGFTLDLSWSSLYDNFSCLLEFLPYLTNVHVQAELVESSEGKHFRPRYGGLHVEGAIKCLVGSGYQGPWTLELNPAGRISDFRRALKYLQHWVND